MTNDYKYNPITNMLDIVGDGGGGGTSGKGGKFVGDAMKLMSAMRRPPHRQ